MIHIHGRTVVRNREFIYNAGEPVFVVEKDGYLDIEDCIFRRIGPMRSPSAFVFDDKGNLRSIDDAIVFREGARDSLVVGCAFLSERRTRYARTEL